MAKQELSALSATPSALSSRIAAGKAEPITAEERAIVAGLRADFERKYGRPAVRRPTKLAKSPKKVAKG
ncbi:hypothetical protein [uncultured Cellulomonas sp.]|uniref:hypothetical protein n=1 Tax=uncultured Cellulomonas sp. TaxID=189682 RepID=UPI0028ED1992|nr:hypothetical protein [uncultured Cellulomonas sp.]